ncbi:MAG: hypothetical protein QM702_05115 [Rubrivivax sp.]
MSRKNITLGVTAFLDILGFGDRVLHAKSTDEVDHIALDVRRIQKEFDYKPRDPVVREVQSNYKKTVLAFSDSVIVNVPLQSEMTELQGTFDGLMSELSSMAFAQARCVNQGLFLRGGVDLGWWYRRGSTLVSQSMVRAYKAEGAANVPVISLTDALYRFFFEHKDRQYYSNDIEPVSRLLRRYTEAGPKGEVDYWYLDYITTFAESIGWMTSKAQREEYLAADSDQKNEIMEAGYQSNLDRWFSHHARTIETAHRLAPSEKVKAKYVWLSKYHNEIAPNYTKLKSSVCTAK